MAERVDTGDLNAQAASAQPAAQINAADTSRTLQAQVVGKSSGQQVAESIIALTGTVTLTELRKSVQEDYIAGSMAAGQKNAIVHIRDEQPWYNKVFGDSATLRGAQAAKVRQSADEFYTAGMQAIQDGDYRSDPSAFREKYSGLFKSTLSGDEETDALITAGYADVAGKLSAAHYKEHTAWTQRENKVVYETGVQAAAEAYSTATKDESKSSPEEIASAYERVQQSIMPLEGQDEASHRDSVTQSIVNTLNRGSSSVLQAARDAGIKFDADQEAQILAAQKSYTQGVEFEYSLEYSTSMADIMATASKHDTYNQGAAKKKMVEHEKKFPKEKGYDWSSILFNNLPKPSDSASKDPMVIVSDYMNPNSFGVETSDEATIGFKGAQQVIKNLYPNASEEEQEALVLNYWSNKAGVPVGSLKTEFSSTLGKMLTSKGEVEPRYQDAFTKFRKFYKKNPKFAAQHVGNDAYLTKFVAVDSLVDAEYDLDTAIKMVGEAQPVSLTPVLREEIGTVVKEMQDTSRWLNVPSWFSPHAKNDAALNARAVQAAEAIVAVTGSTQGLGPALAVILSKTNERLGDDTVYNGGTSVAQRAGVSEISGDELVRWKLRTGGRAAFGDAWYDKEYAGTDPTGNYKVILSTAGDTITVFPRTAEDYPLKGVAPMVLPLKELGKQFKLREIIPGEMDVAKRAQDSADWKFRRYADTVNYGRKKEKLPPYSDEEVRKLWNASLPDRNTEKVGQRKAIINSMVPTPADFGIAPKAPGQTYYGLDGRPINP